MTGNHKACMDCKHAALQDFSQVKCRHPSAGVPNLIYGGFLYDHASIMRRNTPSAPCGPAGKLWEPKPKEARIGFFKRLFWR